MHQCMNCAVSFYVSIKLKSKRFCYGNYSIWEIIFYSSEVFVLRTSKD